MNPPINLGIRRKSLATEPAPAPVNSTPRRMAYRLNSVEMAVKQTELTMLVRRWGSVAHEVHKELDGMGRQRQQHYDGKAGFPDGLGLAERLRQSAIEAGGYPTGDKLQQHRSHGALQPRLEITEKEQGCADRRTEHRRLPIPFAQQKIARPRADLPEYLEYGHAFLLAHPRQNVPAMFQIISGRVCNRVTNRLNAQKQEKMFFIVHASAIPSQRSSATLDAMEHVSAPWALFRPFALSLLALLVAPMLPAAEPARSETTTQRSYRADAHVMLFGMNLISRSGVGGGFARIVESWSGPQKSVRLLFVSGSRPDRAHGLNRMGFIEESVSESNARACHAEYLGFMTASDEESLAAARKALHGPSDGEVQFVASRGEIDGGAARHNVQHLLLPASSRWTDAPHLLGVVEEDLDRPGNEAAYADLSHGERPETFLYTVLGMVRSPARTSDGSFLHNGKLFHLHAVKQADEKAGATFVQSGLMASPRNAVELTGLIRNAKTGVETTFRVWFDRASPNALPLRFEFQPKSYLRLVFEAEPVEDPAVVKVFADPGPGGGPVARAALR